MDVLLGITKGCDDHIYIAETAGKRIIKILDNQKHETFYKAENNWTPVGIDFFAGDAYILEYRGFGRSKGPRIVKVNEAGEKSVIFNYDQYSNIPEKPLYKKSSLGVGIIVFLILVFLRRQFYNKMSL